MPVRTTQRLLSALRKWRSGKPSVPNYTASNWTSHVQNITQIFQTPIGLNVAHITTPHGTINISAASQYQTLRAAAASQHRQQMTQAFAFGAGSTSPAFPNASTIHAMYPGTAPLTNMLKNLMGQGDPDFKFFNIEKLDPEYYEDDEVQAPDVTGYKEVEI